MKTLALAVLVVSIVGCGEMSSDCVAGLNQACPSPKFIKQFNEATEMGNRLNRMADNIRAMVPQPACNAPARVFTDCWQYDQNIQKFVKQVPPPPMPQSAPPAVPPAGAKK